MFSDDMMNGEGTEYMNDGKVYKGTWIDNKKKGVFEVSDGVEMRTSGTTSSGRKVKRVTFS